MPLAFPSHQGLVAPLWRRWPGRFHVLGLCVGAATPDIVDGVVGAWRGYLGQSVGHSLVGLVAFCLPVGLLVTWLTVVVGRKLRRRASERAGTRAWLAKVGRGIGRVHGVPEGASAARRVVFVGASVLVGGFSHLVFDLVSHGSFPWLYPWHEATRFLPSWWYAAWFTLAVPGYREPYPIGPPMVVWTVLSVGGAALLFWPRLRRGRAS